MFDSSKPLIVQKDKRIVLDLASKDCELIRDRLAMFAMLDKASPHIHVYSFSKMSIWNSMASGVKLDDILTLLNNYSKMPPYASIIEFVTETCSRFGHIRMMISRGVYEIHFKTHDDARELGRYSEVNKFFKERISARVYSFDKTDRIRIKECLLKMGYPVIDEAGFEHGDKLEIKLREKTLSEREFHLRDYQYDAVDKFVNSNHINSGSGVIVMPCGAGKTIVGISAMERISESTLILTTNITSVRQWISEILDKTYLDEISVGEYSSAKKDIKDVTVATYSIVTQRGGTFNDFSHLDIFDAKQWGLIIYDEVHSLPAPVFRNSAVLQSRRKLGLTATLIREDNRQHEVFSLVGPKVYEVSWTTLENNGWIAKAVCHEVRIPLEGEYKDRYHAYGVDRHTKHRLSAQNPKKVEVVGELMNRHYGEKILVIGVYLAQLRKIAHIFDLPLITGETPQDERDQLYNMFKSGEIDILVVSKVANFAIDLPDASVAIQVSGTFGSRQEEAQRLGRILRPKENYNYANFYSLVSLGTTEQQFSFRRQLFLSEKGYEYNTIIWK